MGRIAKANLYTSVVELVSSRNFRMAAHFDGEDRPVIYQGVGAVSLQDAKGEVRDVPSDVRASGAKIAGDVFAYGNFSRGNKNWRGCRPFPGG